MIVITGGAGFIGSVLARRLNDAGHSDLLIVDHLGSSEKWKNLVPLAFTDYIDRGDFIERLEHGDFGDDIDVVFHLGACSSTTETNADYLMENNYRYSVRIAAWRETHRKTRLIYASSAATYGNGELGYSDDESRLHALRPLNMYGYSKHLFDLHAHRCGWLSEIVGLKYFNVFGPNEVHKGDMRSVVNKAYPRLRDEGIITLFESHRSDYENGAQRRDFVYVKDAVDMTLFFMEHRAPAGIYNIGTGCSRTWNDLANAMFAALGAKPNISYIPMPETLRPKYQYFTQADTAKLLTAGCRVRCRTLEESVAEYVCDYLSGDGRIS